MDLSIIWMDILIIMRSSRTSLLERKNDSYLSLILDIVGYQYLAEPIKNYLLTHNIVIVEKKVNNRTVRTCYDGFFLNIYEYIQLIYILTQLINSKSRIYRSISISWLPIECLKQYLYDIELQLCTEHFFYDAFLEIICVFHIICENISWNYLYTNNSIYIVIHSLERNVSVFWKQIYKNSVFDTMHNKVARCSYAKA